ncbi:MAG: thymidine kinase [Proteobacteria bacterium]|nr:thymidine kinase [Pseudomonadota bacterium]
MAKMHYFYSGMNAGKTTHLLQANYNYINNGYNTLLIKPAVDDRFAADKITTRLGLDAKALTVTSEQDLKKIITQEYGKKPIDCIMIDEGQFFPKEHVEALAYVADRLDVTIMAYGLKTNIKGELFEGSKRFFELADKLEEIKKICHCGKKATMVLRFDENGEVYRDGPEIQIGAEEAYVSVCREHFFDGNIGDHNRKKIQKTKSRKKTKAKIKAKTAKKSKAK